MNNLEGIIKPLKEEYKIAGRAYTVKLPVGDNVMLLKSLKEAKPGDILVVDSKGDTYRAIAGDFVVGMMKTLELGGLVVDGVIRDIIDIKKLNFPVFFQKEQPYHQAGKMDLVKQTYQFPVAVFLFILAISLSVMLTEL